MFAPIVLLAFTVGAMSGFGSVVIALTLGAQLYSIPEMLSILVPLNLIVNGYLAVRHRRLIDRRLLGARILPFMGLGMAGGLLLARVLDGPLLKGLFGVFVVLVSLRELARIFGQRGAEEPLGPVATYSAFSGAGVMHGIYATGGPLLVYAMGRMGLEKGVFRATLAAVWFALNIGLTAVYAWDGRLAPVSKLTAVAPMVLVGIVLGEFLHHRVDERKFRAVVFTLLVFAGAALAWSVLSAQLAV